MAIEPKKPEIEKPIPKTSDKMFEDEKYLDPQVRYNDPDFRRLLIYDPAGARNLERKWDRKAKHLKAGTTSRQKRYVDMQLYNAAREEFAKAGQVGNCTKVQKALQKRGIDAPYMTVVRLWNVGYPSKNVPALKVALKDDLALAQLTRKQQAEDGSAEAEKFAVESLLEQISIHKFSQQGLTQMLQSISDRTDENGTVQPGLATVVREVLRSWVSDIRRQLPGMTMDQKEKVLRKGTGFMRELEGRFADLVNTQQRLLGRPAAVLIEKDWGAEAIGSEVEISDEERQERIEMLKRQLLLSAGMEEKENGHADQDEEER